MVENFPDFSEVYMEDDLYNVLKELTRASLEMACGNCPQLIQCIAEIGYREVKKGEFLCTQAGGK